jgi:hypothetical protein
MAMTITREMILRVYRPDVDSYRLLFARALGPFLVMSVMGIFILKSISFPVRAYFVFFSLAAIFWGICLCVAFIRRKLYTLIIEIDSNGGVKLEEKLLFKTKRTFDRDHEFRMVQIITLGQLPYIQAPGRFQFGKLLDKRQQSEIVSLLESRRN